MVAMDDFPEDGFLDDLELPVSPTASTFDSLETPTPSQLSFTWSSDEIPILLYDDGYVDEASISRMSIATAGGNRQSSMTLRGAQASYGPQARDRMSMHRGSQASMVDLARLSTLESSSTICSVGTFGPKRKKLTRLDEARMSRYRGAPPGLSSPTAVPPPPTSVSTESGKRSSTVSRQRRSSTQTISSVFANPTVLVTTKRDSISVPNPHDSAQFSPALDSSETPYEVDLSMEIDDSSTCRTPEKPRTTSWISTRDWDCQQYKEYISGVDQSRTPPSVRVPDDHSQERASPQPVTPPRRRILNPHNALTKPRPLPISHEIVDQDVLFPSPKLIRQANDVEWLQDITVQFLVDQEGFRAAQPNFRFASIARLRSSQHSRSPDTVMAQFRPIIRQAFHFHYAPFESLPVLRRVTVNDDETHDYVSKQAYLTMKTNGVYVLYGHEMSTTTHASEASKLYWQFEYLVDDRLLDGSGRIMEGEKLLTPLTFSCTPSLLGPGQGRRNNIMHVFKKGVAPKLVSEKLQAPGTARPQNGAGNAGTLVSSQTDAHISNFFSSKAHTWNVHRRGQSHGVRNAELPTPQAVQRSPASELRQSEQRLPRRRRASSADENHKSAVHPHGISDGHHHVHSASGAIPIAQHIVPPAKLTRLLGNPVEGSTRDTSSLSTKCDTGGFIPLTPRPRHAHTKVIEPVRTL